MAKPQVAIVGRTNVGKSTLFNRLVGRRQAVVAEQPGITRDRLYGTAEIEGRSFLLVDTGGLFGDEQDPLHAAVTRHAEVAVNEADVILFVVDGIEGITSFDYDIADLVRRSGKPYLLVANKMESPKRTSEDFLALRLGEPIDISAAHGAGTADLEEALYALLPPIQEEEDADEEAIRVAIVGRPNVGKSALLNAIAGEERVIVSEVPGTTRDAIDVRLTRDGQDFILVDTAGLRRKKKVKQSTEYWSVLRSLRAIDRAHIALLVLDAHEGVTEQDAKIAGYAMEAGAAAIIVANKWDLVRDAAREYAAVYEDDPRSRRTTARRQEKTLRADFERQVRRILSFLDYADVLYTSAVAGAGLDDLLAHVVAVAENHARRVGTGELNRAILRAVQRHHPPSRKGRQLKIYYATQPQTRPPTVVLFVNDPRLMHFSYERYLVNALRDEFGFRGTPVRLFVRARQRQRPARSSRKSRQPT